MVEGDFMAKLSKKNKNNKKASDKEYSCQQVNSLHIEKLKNIRNLEISFDETPLTAIVGSNGTGKSSILHALACCYNPISVKDNKKNVNKGYMFCEFFISNTDTTWKDSKFTLKHTYRIKEKLQRVSTTFTKDSQWKPRYEKRVSRHVVYIGILSCVPQVEKETNRSIIRYNTLPLSDTESNEVIKNARFVMNRLYDAYNQHNYFRNGKTNTYIGVELNHNKYSSLSMSAGEQRIFHILTEVIRAPKYALILIDELDLLLHIDAQKRLLKVLKDLAERKYLQIIFTTHSAYIMQHHDNIAIRCLYDTSEKTLCYDNANLSVMNRLTGDPVRPIEIFVEDDFANEIVINIATSLGIKKYVHVIMYGSASNCFTTAAGLLLSNKLTEKMLFVLDGDKLSSPSEIETSIERCLTGNTQNADRNRRIIQDYIKKFNLQSSIPGFNPEAQVHKFLSELDQDQTQSNEITNIAANIHSVHNNHDYVNDILKQLGYEDNRQVGIYKIISVASNHSKWSSFVEPVYNWLLIQKQDIIHTPSLQKESS